MASSKRNRFVKISAFILISLLLTAVVGFFYISNVAKGSNEGKLPEGHQLVAANGFEFSVKINGNPEDTAVIFLHGFPESSVIWDRLMAQLSDSGYYTIAPNQRGYSFKARPKDVDQYHISYLASDVVEIANSLGIDKFHLVGHDWGAGVGWKVAAEYPGRIYSFTAMAVPHLDALARAYQEDSLQYEASGYVRRFQTKILPEYIMARNDYALMRGLWKESDPKEVEANISILSQKNAATSMINWYRANYNVFAEGINLGKITVPVLFLWGNQDFALQRSGAEWTKDYADGYYRFIELDVGHSLTRDAYDTVHAEIEAHLRQF